MSRPSRTHASSSRAPRMDSRKFQNVQQYENWSQFFQNRPLRKEAEVVVSDFLGHPVVRYFDDLGWNNMLSLNGRVNVSWVKEFYANMDKNRSTAFEFHTWVWGSYIGLTADIWSRGRDGNPTRPRPDPYPLGADSLQFFGFRVEFGVENEKSVRIRGGAGNVSGCL